MKFSVVGGVALLALAVHGDALAGELSPSDLDRAQILKVVKNEVPGLKRGTGNLVVLDLFKDGDSAFLCATDGQRRTSDGTNWVYVIPLKKYVVPTKTHSSNIVWMVEVPGYTDHDHSPSTAADCTVDGQAIRNRDDIAHLAERNTSIFQAEFSCSLSYNADGQIVSATCGSPPPRLVRRNP